MIKYIILNTDIINITIFDGNITFYIAKGIDFTQPFLNYDIRWVFNSLYGSTSSFIDVTSLGNFDTPKLLNATNFNNLIPFFHRYVDIVNNIGIRPNIYIFSYHHNILNNTPLFIGGFVILAVSIKNLLYNNIIYAKGYIFKLLSLLENSLARKNSAKYLTDKFLKYIKLNFVGEHLRNFRVFMGPRTRLTPFQRTDPVITELINQRSSQSDSVYTWSNSARRIANQLVTLIEVNDVIVYESPDSDLSMTVPINLPTDQEQEIRNNLASWDTDLNRSIDRLTEAFDRCQDLETELRNRGVVLQPFNFSTPLRRAREAHASFRSKIVKITEEQQQ